MGHSVTVYEQRAKLGGMLRYGIPNYRLPKTLLDTEIEHIRYLRIGEAVRVRGREGGKLRALERLI